MVSDEDIIRLFFRCSKGLKGVAGVLGVSKIRVGKVITRYKRFHRIR